MDGSGAKGVKYTYDAWGKLISTASTLTSTECCLFNLHVRRASQRFDLVHTCCDAPNGLSLHPFERSLGAPIHDPSNFIVFSLCFGPVKPLDHVRLYHEPFVVW